jgi:uncharacterized membrane protein YdfJ with MMPL/SSD domain
VSGEGQEELLHFRDVGLAGPVGIVLALGFTLLLILGVAVLLDTFLIRLVLLPVLLRLTGRAAWACPRWLRRALPAIRFSH